MRLQEYGVNGSIAVSKTVGAGSNPATPARLQSNDDDFIVFLLPSITKKESEQQLFASYI